MMKKLVLALAFLAAHATNGQMLQAIIAGGSIPPGPPPPPLNVSNPACFVMGAVTTYTTPAIDTTGATLIDVIVTFDSGAGSVAVSDNKGNGSPTALSAYGTGSNILKQLYWVLPSAGTGHTFTIATSSTNYGAVCIVPITGGIGVFDTGSGGGSGAACQAPTINPGSGQHIVVAATSTNGTTASPTVDSGYTLDGYQNFGAGVNYGIGAAHLIQSPSGYSTSPTWTPGSPCSVASFH
jgi:hypothetical protein